MGWVGLGLCPSVAYPSCEGEWLPWCSGGLGWVGLGFCPSVAYPSYEGECVFIFSTTLNETFLVVRSTQPDDTINVHRSSCKEFVSDFNES